MAHTWSPSRYLAYADERGRPFLDLVARVDPAGECAPERVVDLGCGPGNLTALLTRRWPSAEVIGIDSSPEMVAGARADEAARRVRFEVGDLRDWQPTEPVDVLVSNATLQWVPGHLGLLARLVESVRVGGWLALQVPGNFAEPTHTLRRRLAGDQRFAPYLSDVAEPAAYDAQAYLEELTALGCEVDAWETTYLHLLHGDDPVFTWTTGTGARPTLLALPPGPREQFAAEYREALAAAYPPGPHGTLLPFRRVFVVARRLSDRPAAPGSSPDAPDRSRRG